MSWIRVQMAGWFIRAALMVYPRSAQRQALAEALDRWMTEQLDPHGLTGRTVTIHRRVAGNNRG